MFTSQQLPSIIEMIRSQGRNGDTMLAHITPQEAEMLKQMGGSGTINPNTGLPEFFFPSIISSVFGGGNPSGVLNAFGGGFFKKILSNPETIQKAIIAGLIPSTQAPKAFKQMKDNAMLLPKSPQTNNAENTSLPQQKLDKTYIPNPLEINSQIKNSEEIFRPYDVSGIAGQMIGNAVLPGVGGLVGKQIGKFVGQKAQKYQYPSVQGVLKSAFETSPSYALSGRWEE